MYPSTKNVDIEKVAFEVARNQCGPKYSVNRLIPDLGLTDVEFGELLNDPLFIRKVRDFVKMLEADGVSFQLKARVQAEDLLATSYKLAKHPDTPPMVAAKLIENTVRWAGWERKVSEAAPELGGKFSININLGSGTPPVVTVDVPRENIEQPIDSAPE